MRSVGERIVYTATVILAFTATAPAASAQSIRQLRLSPPLASLSEEFTISTSVRELADGRVMVTESRDRGIVVADFARDAVAVVGRKGNGPGEYQLPGSLYVLRSDSSLVAEIVGRRWYVLHGDRIVRTLPPDLPAIVATRGVIYSADSLGRVLVLETPPLEGTREVTERDSAYVALIDRSSGRADTVTAVRRRPQTETRITDERGRVVQSGSAPTVALAAEEGALLFPDGWLAVARLDPFRIDWRRPDGTWVMGKALPVPVIRYSARERAARERRNRPRTTAIPKGFPVPPAARSTARYLPPFESGRSSLQAASDGRLLVRRTPSADFEGTRYLVVSRAGQLDGELVLPTSTRIVGFGRGTVYVREADAEEVQRLRRHAWPPR